jgi:hypothetical protein
VRRLWVDRTRWRQKIAALLREVEVNEVIFVSDLFRHSDRLRSYEIAMEAMSVGEVRAPVEL